MERQRIAEPFDSQTLANIRMHGFSIVGVPQFRGPKSPSLMYSVGLGLTRNVPELCVTGVVPPTGAALIHDYAQRVATGERFAPNVSYAEFLEGYPVRFFPVRASQLRWLGQASWLYHHEPFTAVQLVYPSKEGLWPWDADYPQRMKRAQLLLCDTRQH